MPARLTLLCSAALLALLASSAIAGDTIKDPSAAFACHKKGQVVSYYSPFGRAPTMSEQAQCRRLGGRIARPKAPALTLDRKPAR